MSPAEEKIEQTLILEKLRDDFVALTLDVDQLRRPTKFLLAPDQFSAVCVQRYTDIRISMDLEDGNPLLRQRSEAADGVVLGQLFPQLRFSQPAQQGQPTPYD